ncbi:hypothetical protein CUMW_257320 [Citrus unshiu]|uniref:Uncharacterized protein n=1 Tax=Citrus unshiu TaxID=55188 RepID=A0A2H5QSE1_CITUN|nr:hypothetical protein CUMW_257320 [Citrus unshiu]
MITSSWEFDWYLPLLVGLLAIGDSVRSVYQIRLSFSFSHSISLFSHFLAPSQGAGQNWSKRWGGILQDKWIDIPYYQNIKGNSATNVAMTLDSSASNPCKGIRLQDIKLTYYGKSFVAYCEHVHGSSSGVVIPRSCL